nr:hypothetical protein [Deltaproteobacteria bacterium]
GNATVEETFARYGQRLLSRAIEGGRGWLVQVKGDDLRVGDRVPPLPTEREVDGPWLEPVVLGARAAKAGRRYRGELVEAKRLPPPATVERRDGEALARSMAAARLLAYTEEAARRGEPWARTALCRAEPGPKGAV